MGHMQAVAREFHEVQKEVRADHATLFIVDRDTDELYVQDGDIRMRIPKSRGIVGLVATSGETVRIADAYAHPHFSPDVDKKTGYRTRSVLAAPILGPNSVVGVVQFINKLDAEAKADQGSAPLVEFTAADQARIEEICQRISVHVVSAQTQSRMSVTGCLSFVCLAGSERAARTGASGSSLKDVGGINKSLLMLSQVMSSLAERKPKPSHIPFRSSKLTHILATSLGGNSNTCILCAMSPARSQRHEAVATLDFGLRAMSVVNHVSQNRRCDVSPLVRSYQSEIEKLRTKLGHALSPSDSMSRIQVDGPGAGTEIDLAASEAFTSKFIRLCAEVAEAQEYASISVSSALSPVRLRALIGCSGAAGEAGSVELCVAACRSEMQEVARGSAPEAALGSAADEGTETLLLTEAELRARLAWLRRCLASAPQEEQQAAWAAAALVDFDLWAAATRAVAAKGAISDADSLATPPLSSVTSPLATSPTLSAAVPAGSLLSPSFVDVGGDCSGSSALTELQLPVAAPAAHVEIVANKSEELQSTVESSTRAEPSLARTAAAVPRSVTAAAAPPVQTAVAAPIVVPPASIAVAVPSVAPLASKTALLKAAAREAEQGRVQQRAQRTQQQVLSPEPVAATIAQQQSQGSCLELTTWNRQLQARVRDQDAEIDKLHGRVLVSSAAVGAAAIGAAAGAAAASSAAVSAAAAAGATAGAAAVGAAAAGVSAASAVAAGAAAGAAAFGATTGVVSPCYRVNGPRAVVCRHSTPPLRSSPLRPSPSRPALVAAPPTPPISPPMGVRTPPAYASAVTLGQLRPQGGGSQCWGAQRGPPSYAFQGVLRDKHRQ